MDRNNLLTSLIKKKYLLWLLLVLVLTFLAYLPILNNKFLKTWDDNRYVIENKYIQHLSPASIGKMFTIYYDGHYHPLTLISLAIDFAVAGLSPQFYHVHSLYLHLLNTLLLFSFLYLLLRKQNLIIPLTVSFLFGICTMHIESVAWASERKNLLYTLYFLASLVAYIRYIDSGKNWMLLISLFLFLLSILSKSTAITLGFTIVLIDIYFRRNVFSRQVIFEKVPFFLLAVIFGIVAVYAQKSTWGEDLSQVHYSLFDRFLFSGYAFIIYIVKLLFPFRLSGFYPYPEDVSARISLIYLVFVTISAVSVVGAVYLFKRRRNAAFGFLFYSINIFLLLKLFEIPAGDYIMADRYAYVPSIGIFLIMATGFQWLTNGKLWLKYAGRLILILYSVVIFLQTFNRVPVWEDDISFFSDIILKYPGVETAYTNRGAARKEIHDLKGALNDFNMALEIGNKDYRAYSNRASVYLELGDFTNALADYREALKRNSGHPQILADYGYTQMQTGDLKGAFESYSKSLEKNSFNPDAWSNRGTVRYKAGDFNGAIADYDMAAKQNTGYKNAYFNRALAKLQINEYNGAIEDLLMTIKLDSAHVQAYSNMGVAWSRLNNFNKAMECYNKAISLQPGFSEAWLNRAIDRYYAGDLSGSIADLNKTIELNSSLAPAYYFRAMAQLKAGNKNICDDLQYALKLGFQPASNAVALHCR
jgi:tetratricopeptide (TPR) repeat protein